MVLLLLDAGANLEAKDEHGQTAEDYARSNGKDQVLAVRSLRFLLLPP